MKENIQQAKPTSPQLSLTNIQKFFSGREIIKGISLDIFKGEFITLLGPSGCGKTTTLRLIAGLETLDGGAIFLNGSDISSLEPNKRNVNTVFQNYALFPHMNVYDNIAYGLKIKKLDKNEIKARVFEMLELVQLSGYEKYMSDQLSGGMRQRVAIARALVNRPEILLLDEPLGALDLKLRQHMQVELKRIQAKTHTTFIYVTHDQDEALNLSDRLVVMQSGCIEQIDKPSVVYHKPTTRFVAQFVGDRNILECEVTGVDGQGGKARLDFCGQEIIAPKENLSVGEKVLVVVHSDQVRISDEDCQYCFLKGTVTERYYTGAQTKTNVLLSNGFNFNVVEYGKRIDYNEGDEVYVGWDVLDGIVIKEESR